MDVNISYIDSRGVIIDSEGHTVSVVPAGQKYYFGETGWAHNQKAVELSISVAVGSTVPAQYHLPGVTGLHMGTNDIHEAAVVGVVDNTTSAVLSNGTNVNVVAFDASGKVIGGNFEGLTADVPAGAKVQFDSVQQPTA